LLLTLFITLQISRRGFAPPPGLFQLSFDAAAMLLLRYVADAAIALRIPIIDTAAPLRQMPPRRHAVIRCCYAVFHRVRLFCRR
jgi:hypothetical protein